MTKSENILRIFLITVIVHVMAIRVKLSNMQCAALDQNIGDITKCSLKAIKRGVAEINFYFRLDKKPVNNASVKLRLAKRGAHKQSALYQYKVDLCEFLRSSRRNPLADIFYSFFELKIYSNFNHTCPYDHDLIVEHCRVNTQPLSILPISQGDYMIFTSWLVNEKPVVNVDFAINSILAYKIITLEAQQVCINV